MWGEHDSMMWRGEDFWSLSMLGGGWLMFFGLILGTALVALLVVFFVRQHDTPGGIRRRLRTDSALSAVDTGSAA